MPKRSSKRPPEDEVQAAFEAVARLTGSAGLDPDKNVAAQLLGRLGGLKGGKARAKKLSATRRSEIAKKAAAARWSKKAK